MRLSESRQKNAVSEGFALGLSMHGRDSILIDGYHMTSVNLAISHAWRNWNYRHRFPRVNSQFERHFTENFIVTHASLRSRTTVFYWERYNAIARHGWDLPGEHADAADMIDGNVPAEGWALLAATFLERLAPKQRDTE